MKMRRLCVLLAVICLLACVVPFAASATENTDVLNGFAQDGYVYYRDGEMVVDEVIEHEGAYYGFDESGWRYTNQEFHCDGYWYRAKEDGTLYVDEWYINPDWSRNRFYYGAEGKAIYDFVEMDGVWYFFYGDGCLAMDGVVWSNDYQAYYVLSEDGTDHQRISVEGWNQIYGNWYYVKDGHPLMGEVIQLGDAYYGFDWSGKMADDCVIQINDHFYRAEAGGKLMTNRWYTEREDNLYYYGADGAAPRGWATISGKEYWFYYDGRVARNVAISQWVDEKYVYYAFNADGTQHVLLDQAGLHNAFGIYYYLQEVDSRLELTYNELVEVNGKYYYFNWTGKAVTNEIIEIWDENDNWNIAYATADASLLKGSWLQVGNEWYYAGEDCGLYTHGVYEIGGELYYFEDFVLVTVGGERWIHDYENNFFGNVYITNGTGKLYRNAWYYDKTTYPESVGWRYYGVDGIRLEDELAQIGGTYYFFDYEGEMITNAVREAADGVYMFDAEGRGTVLADGWHQTPVYEEWIYISNGDMYDGILDGGASVYYLDEGYMVYNDWHYATYHGVEGAYLFGADGKMIKTPGDHIVNGSVYTVTENGTLYQGWLQSGSNWYYMEPAMLHDCIFYAWDELVYYAADGAGVCTKLTGTGFYRCDSFTAYIENGVPVRNEWRKINGSWYYFDEDGWVYQDEVSTINGSVYLFGEGGKLHTNGWFYKYGEWYYADSSEVAYTGLRTIDGKQYVFSKYGRLYTGGIYTVDDVAYICAENGQVIAIAENQGWIEAAGNWYYVKENGYFAQDELLEIGNATYGFDRNGVMIENGMARVWNNYYGECLYLFGADGQMLYGWQQYNGKWVYADAEDGMLCGWGEHYIDGKRYCFDENCVLMIGTFELWGSLYTTDENGVVISQTALPNGWRYDDGHVYLENGNRNYNGWLGDYYFEGGRMLTDTLVEYDGAYYYVDATGRYIHGTWYERWHNDWILAREDGTLYCNEWYQEGDTWYYFYATRMARNTVYTIDGVDHEFDKSGKWLGEVTYEEEEPLPEHDYGWVEYDGEWYYYHAGQPVTLFQVIGGKHYVFDYSGVMLANTLAPVDYNGAYMYYGADGAAVTYVGWHQIDGEWYYFNEDHTVALGWFNDNGRWYYLEEVWEKEEYREYCHMLTNTYAVMGEKLYWLNAEGYATAPVQGTGWHQDGNIWYYLNDGILLQDEYAVIGGTGYYFDYDGWMAEDYVVWVEDEVTWNGGCKYASASGAIIEEPGWHEVTDGWIYVGEDGYLYSDGIYQIGDKLYAFRDCYWVEDATNFGHLDLDIGGQPNATGWQQDANGWYYLDENGNRLVSQWMLDSTGWCYLGADGYMATNEWILDSVGWCYVGTDGYCVTNSWMKDSVGWVYLDGEGRMVTNAWVMDSKGWCYLGADGYAVTNCWKQDSTGWWCYLDSEGSMVKNAWVDGYWINADGYWIP